MVSKVAKPSEAEAKALAKFFPSASSCVMPTKKFDASADCVVLRAQKQKKAAIKGQSERPVTVSIVMMRKYCPVIPKGKVRKRLASEGRMQNLKVTRSMNAKPIREKILHGFGVLDYTVLECDSTGHTLLKSCDQDNIDGELAIQRRGCLYLCEVFEVCRPCYIMQLHYCLLFMTHLG